MVAEMFFTVRTTWSMDLTAKEAIVDGVDGDWNKRCARVVKKFDVTVFGFRRQAFHVDLELLLKWGSRIAGFGMPPRRG